MAKNEAPNSSSRAYPVDIAKNTERAHWNRVEFGVARDVKSSGHFSVIVYETSDTSKAEQVLLSLSLICHWGRNICWIFATESTEGEVLIELVKKSVTNPNLLLSNTVGECFNGAANMSGSNMGVALQMKECSPLALYVHCYAHHLNLGLQDTMTNIEPICHALGTIQSL